MSNKNDEMAGFVLVFAFVGAIATLFIVVVYALAVVLSTVLTFLAFLAWDKPRKFGGEVITPEEARLFVGSGVIGAAVLLSLVAICSALLSFRVPDQYWIHIILGGYAFGSLGVALHTAEEEHELVMIESSEESKLSAVDLSILDDSPEAPSQPQPVQPAFRYATWDDEEARR